jgi:hypothetical protein
LLSMTQSARVGMPVLTNSASTCVAQIRTLNAARTVSGVEYRCPLPP